jgi:undecaprenyl phosphate N,N'-diacetylbacillosamine 1-phosphate transferase
MYKAKVPQWIPKLDNNNEKKPTGVITAVPWISNTHTIGEEPELYEKILAQKTLYNDIIKPCADILTTLAFSPLWLPLLATIYTAILLADRQNPIFVQSRTINSISQDGEKEMFKMFKFTSMKGGEVTKIGTILRKYSIDELPQLLNVLKGDMSLVGPRPRLLEEEVPYQYPHNLKPGVTSPWQMQRKVKTDGRSPKDDQNRLDYQYSQRLWNGIAQFQTDIAVLFQTISYVIKGKNA